MLFFNNNSNFLGYIKKKIVENRKEQICNEERKREKKSGTNFDKINNNSVWYAIRGSENK